MLLIGGKRSVFVFSDWGLFVLFKLADLLHLALKIRIILIYGAFGLYKFTSLRGFTKCLNRIQMRFVSI